MYGSVAGADTYWAARLNGTFWAAQSATIKAQALQSAADRINRLPINGTPDPDNTNGDVFPLDDAEGIIPSGIVTTAYELAYCLILNPDPTGAGNQGTNVKRTKIGQTETEFFGTVAPWIAAGIPCQNVWLLLVPYLVDPLELTLNRVS